MGFFAQNGGFADGKEWANVEAGTYKCALVGVDVVDRPSFEDRTKLEPNFRFRFETIEVGDDNGNPFRFTQFTKTYYGNDMAKLTKLLDSMLGRRLTSAEFSRLDIDDLKSRPWSVTVDLIQTNSGKEMNVILAVKPFATKAAAKPVRKPPVEDDIEDPFAE